MSLDWSIQRVDDWKGLHESDDEWRITDSLIWATMEVGLDNIAEKNIDKWLFRLAMLRNCYGEAYREGATKAALARRIGLSTNASTLTDTAFKGKVFTVLSRNAKLRIERIARELEDAEGGSDDRDV